MNHREHKMSVIFLALLLAMQTTSAQELAAPQYPRLAFRGGNVAAIVQPAKESSKVTILHAEEPYVEAVMEALSQWRRDKDTIVVVNFKSWPDMENIDNGIKFKPAIREIDCPQKNRRLPVPELIVDPVLPDPEFFDIHGSIIVRLRISASGAVQGVDVVQGTEDYNQAIIKAVTQWKFLPARDEAGVPVESEAYGICVYRLLITQAPVY
jgi:TonB family protein